MPNLNSNLPPLMIIEALPSINNNYILICKVITDPAITFVVIILLLLLYYLIVISISKICIIVVYHLLWPLTKTNLN